MLRINTQACDCGERLQLEGSLTSPYVPELQQVVADALHRSSHVVLDLSELTYVDADGTRLLRELVVRKLPFYGCSAFVEHLLGLR